MGCSVTQDPAPQAALSLWVWGVAVGCELTSLNWIFWRMAEDSPLPRDCCPSAGTATCKPLGTEGFLNRWENTDIRRNCRVWLTHPGAAAFVLQQICRVIQADRPPA